KGEGPMEAKVDIRKLQLLNDRINQTIDALNQVRLTVHGLGHSNPYQQMSPFVGGGFGTSPIGGTPFGQQFGQPYGPQGIGGQGSFVGGVTPFTQGGVGGFGLQHSNPFGGYNPLLAQGLGGQQNPLMQTLGLGGVGGFGGTSGVMGGIGGIGGLLHSNPDVIENQLLLARASDPSRITTTFPFAFQP